MQMKLNSYNTYFDTLIPELKRLELDIDKAKAWFKDNPLQLDLHLRGYSEKIRLTWLNEIFSHDITIQEMSLRTKVANTKDKELGAQLNHINSFFFRKTIFGLIKYCTESSGNWVDPVKQDNVYRFAWFHHVIANELDAAFHSWIKGEVGKYLLCSIPPQHAKSTLFAGGLIPMIMGNVPTAKGVLGTYNADFAASVLQKDTMNIIDSDGYVKLFGRIFNKNLSATEKKTFTLNGITPPTDSAQKKGTTKGGRIFAGSMKQLTGNPAQFILIDDPIPNAAVARSEDEVNKITQEYDASAMSRVRNNTLVAVIHCIAGDANILLSDNTTKRMDELRVGDVLKTYDKATGKPRNNEVLHFIPQGRDKVYRIKTKSTNVKANERHPFLVDRIKV